MGETNQQAWDQISKCRDGWAGRQQAKHVYNHFHCTVLRGARVLHSVLRGARVLHSVLRGARVLHSVLRATHASHTVYRLQPAGA